MNILLRCETRGACPDIAPTGHVFAVGAKQPPFVALPEKIRETLALRHAQLFEENGVVCVLNLGSGESCQLNGRDLGEDPQQLREGDSVSFGALTFNVRYTQAPDKTPSPAQEMAQDTALLSEEGTQILASPGEDIAETRLLVAGPEPEDITAPHPGIAAEGNDTQLLPEGDGAAATLLMGDHTGSPTPDVVRVEPRSRPAKRRAGVNVVLAAVFAVFGVCALALLLIKFIGTEGGSSPQQTLLGRADTLAAAETLAQRALAQGEGAELPARLWWMQRESDDEGLNSLLDDANRFALLEHLGATGQAQELTRRYREGRFNSRLFEAAAGKTIEPQLLPLPLMTGLDTASAQWAQGELRAAVLTLRPLAGTANAAVIDARLAHYRRAIEYHDTLIRALDSAGPEAALTAYLNLDPMEDRFHWRNLAGDAQSNALAQALTPLMELGAQWEQYWVAGGINADLRQQATLSTEFSTQALRLSTVARLLAQVAAVAAREAPGLRFDQMTLVQQVSAEQSYQRHCLERLIEASDDSKMREKLALLEP